MRSYSDKVSELLDAGVEVLIYVGVGVSSVNVYSLKAMLFCTASGIHVTGISLRMRTEDFLGGVVFLLIKRCCCRGLDLQLAWESRWVQPCHTSAGIYYTRIPQK